MTETLVAVTPSENASNKAAEAAIEVPAGRDFDELEVARELVRQARDAGVAPEEGPFRAPGGPYGVAVDGSGAVYLTNTYNSQVLKLPGPLLAPRVLPAPPSRSAMR